MATLYVNNFLSWLPVRQVWANNNGTWTRVRAVWENNNGTWRVIQASFQVDASNGSGSASGFSNSGLVVGSTNPVTVTGNIGSVSYSWSHLSTAQGPTPSIVGPTTSAPSFEATVTDGTQSISSWRVTVTDATTGSTATDDMTVTLTWTNLN